MRSFKVIGNLFGALIMAAVTIVYVHVQQFEWAAFTTCLSVWCMADYIVFRLKYEIGRSAEGNDDD